MAGISKNIILFEMKISDKSNVYYINSIRNNVQFYLIKRFWSPEFLYQSPASV